MTKYSIYNLASILGCLFVLSSATLVFAQGDEVANPEMVMTDAQSLLINESDTIDLGFTSNDKKYTVGAVSAINPASILEYDNNQSVRDIINGRILGLYGNSNVRGLGNAMVVVDGIPGRPLDILNSEEIEQITVLKDANAVALYGAMGMNGVIVVTTKRGTANQRRSNVNVSYGVMEPVSLPRYLGSADYMQLFNEARLNDGLDSAFNQSTIDNFRNSTNPYKYPDVDYYSDKYLRSFADYTNALAEFSGGSKNSTYYINLGYTRMGSLINLNPDVNKGTHRFNVRGNVDFKVNDWISSSLDVVSIISSTKSSQADLLQAGTTRKPHIFAPLLPVSMIDTANNSELKGKVDAANLFFGNILGGNRAFQNNTPIAETLAGGYVENIFRSTQVNNAIDLDLSMITEGLSAKTYLSFDFYNMYTSSVNNTYSLYEPTWSGDTIVNINRIGNQDKKDLTENVNTRQFFSRYGFYGMLNYDKQLNDSHGINASLVGFGNNMNIRNQIQSDKNAHLALQVRYNYNRKLLVDFSAAYVNSVKLPENNRTKLSPSIGVGYILSEESFLESSDWINYLKVKGSAGIVNSDIGIWDYFLYDEVWSQGGGGFNWADGSSNQRTRISQGSNNNLTFERRKDINIGIEAVLFNNLWLEMNAFQSEIDNQVTRLNNQYPSFYDDFMPFGNFNVDRFQGIELGANYYKTFGKLAADFGVRMMYTNSERIKVDEAYEDGYQYRAGKPVDAIWGLEDLGFYGVNDFDDNGNLKEGLPKPAYGEVRPGDIRYADQNQDLLIDNQDQVHIGRWRDPFIVSANLRLQYGPLSLFMLGDGQYGSEQMLNGNYYWVDGNDKYSEVVWGRWTDETAATATFPRLSSQDNNNNFRNSTFWLINNSFFQLRRVQLSYELPEDLVNSIFMKNLNVFVSGSNLLEFSKNKEERQLQIGGNPMFRYYSAGLRAKF